MKIYTLPPSSSLSLYTNVLIIFLIISRILMHNPYQSFDLIKMKESVFKSHVQSRC